MYIQLKDFNSFMSPGNKDELSIFWFESVFCVLLQRYHGVASAWAHH